MLFCGHLPPGLCRLVCRSKAPGSRRLVAIFTMCEARGQRVQVASLLRVLLLETHDQPAWLKALCPVIAECCKVLAHLASRRPVTFVAAVKLLTALAKQLDGSGAAPVFSKLAADDSVPTEAQTLFHLLAATASDTCDTDANAAEGAAAAMEQSRVAPAAAAVLGDGFAAAADSRLQGVLVDKALRPEARGDEDSECEPQQAACKRRKLETLQ